MDALVVGSGPASLSAAYALRQRGCAVTIVDVGVALEPSQRAIQLRMANREPEDWDPADVQSMKQGMQATTKGVPKKLVYASDYVYREQPRIGSLDVQDAKAVRSFALGGLSNVWGACIAPYPEQELADWPISAGALRRHYDAVLEFMPTTAGRDGDTDSRLPASRQAAALLGSLDARHRDVEAAGIRYRKSELAVDVEGNGHGGCRQCGLCLYGCPYELIFSSRRTVDEMLTDEGVTYRRGIAIDQFGESEGRAFVRGRKVEDGTGFELAADKVFIGAGILETARMTLASMNAWDQPVTLLHSDKFTIPFLRFRATRGVRTERLHTLSQLFMEIEDARVADEIVHLQWYTYNDLYRAALQGKLGAAHRLLGIPMRMVLERLMIVFGYLHSNQSSHMELRLNKTAQGDAALTVKGRSNPVARVIARRVVGKLRKQWRSFGGLPVNASLDAPGGGNHSGGSFPMRKSPGRFETDSLGRPAGLQNVHLVDASVLPSLSAATITYTAMANAHRIAHEAVN